MRCSQVYFTVESSEISSSTSIPGNKAEENRKLGASNADSDEYHGVVYTCAMINPRAQILTNFASRSLNKHAAPHRRIL